MIKKRQQIFGAVLLLMFSFLTAAYFIKPVCAAADASALTVSGSSEGSKTVSAGSNTDVRIGLEALYAKKSSITIKNTEIGMGYCINGSYITEAVFESSTGFTFTPDTGRYIASNSSYYSYNAAKNAAAGFKQFGVNAYPVVLYRNMWKVYIEYNGEKPEKADSVFSGFAGTELDLISYIDDSSEMVLVKGNGIVFIIDAGIKKAYPQFKPMLSNSAGDYVINLGDRSYRGRIEVGRYNSNTVSAVNILNIESYLYSVVPSEMIYTWPQEALKAQAVCARSYALSKSAYYADSSLDNPYTLNDTTKTQVYKGYGAEHLTTTKAVNDTKGEVMTYNGRVVTAFFYSTSGGRTEDVKYVWSGSFPYLKSVVDRYESEPEKKPWSVTYTAQAVEDILKKNGYSSGSINNIYTAINTDSARAYMVRFSGNQKSILIKGTSVREMFNLSSTKFKIISCNDTPDMAYVVSSYSTGQISLNSSYVISAGGKVTSLEDIAEENSSRGKYNNFQYIAIGADNMSNYPAYAPSAGSYVFAGMGYGHGVGMSQSGAKGMALAGYKYKDILKWYYNGVIIESTVK